MVFFLIDLISSKFALHLVSLFVQLVLHRLVVLIKVVVIILRLFFALLTLFGDIWLLDGLLGFFFIRLLLPLLLLLLFLFLLLLLHMLSELVQQVRPRLVHLSRVSFLVLIFLLVL